MRERRDEGMRHKVTHTLGQSHSAEISKRAPKWACPLLPPKSCAGTEAIDGPVSTSVNNVHFALREAIPVSPFDSPSASIHPAEKTTTHSRLCSVLILPYVTIHMDNLLSTPNLLVGNGGNTERQKVLFQKMKRGWQVGGNALPNMCTVTFQVP